MKTYAICASGKHEWVSEYTSIENVDCFCGLECKHCDETLNVDEIADIMNTIKIDKTLPYPYLPGYAGTSYDRQKEFKKRLKLLLNDLDCLSSKYEQNKNDTSLLADLEKCQEVVREMLD